MKAVNPVPEILMHGCLGIGSLCSLENHSCLLCFKLVNLNKRKLIQTSSLRQKLILQFTAHGHDLFKELFNPMTVEIVMGE